MITPYGYDFPLAVSTLTNAADYPQLVCFFRQNVHCLAENLTAKRNKCYFLAWLNLFSVIKACDDVAFCIMARVEAVIAENYDPIAPANH